MKVLDLQCHHGHTFEGWFGSEDDFQSQLSRGLVECPMCGNSAISKKLSAPRLNLGAGRDVTERATKTEAKSVNTDNDATNSIASRAISTGTAWQDNQEKVLDMQAIAQNPELQAAWLHIARKVMAQTEDVGTQFASEARKIHYGEAKERGIRGQASRDETLELLDEGIHVMPLPLPKAFNEPLH